MGVIIKLLSGNEIIAQIISFLILLLLLRIFVWKKILGLIDARRERIASDFKRIDEARTEVDKLKVDYEAKLAQIETLMDKKIEEAREEGKSITEEMRKTAHLEAQRITESARADIKYELAKAKEDLKNKVIDLTISATERIIQEKLNEEDEKRLAKDFIDGIDEIK